MFLLGFQKKSLEETNSLKQKSVDFQHIKSGAPYYCQDQYREIVEKQKTNYNTRKKENASPPQVRINYVLQTRYV